MTDRLPHLLWLRSFEAAGRHLSFTLAADELGLTQAAVSQHIRNLEQALQVDLFDRGRRGVELTAPGASYLPHVQAAFASLAHTTDDLFGKARRPELSLVTPASFAALWLAPRLPAFMQAVPDLALKLTTMTAPADYTAANADLEIRFGAGQWPNLQAHRLTAEYMTPVCQPSLRRQDWWTLPLLTVRGAREMWRDWFMMAGQPLAAHGFCSFDTFIIALEAAKAGAGVLLGSRPLIDAALASGELLRLSDLDLPSPHGHFLAYRAEEAQTPAMRAVINWFLREAGRGSPPTSV